MGEGRMLPTNKPNLKKLGCRFPKNERLIMIYVIFVRKICGEMCESTKLFALVKVHQPVVFRLNDDTPGNWKTKFTCLIQIRKNVRSHFGGSVIDCFSSSRYTK